MYNFIGKEVFAKIINTKPIKVGLQCILISWNIKPELINTSLLRINYDRPTLKLRGLNPKPKIQTGCTTNTFVLIQTIQLIIIMFNWHRVT